MKFLALEREVSGHSAADFQPYLTSEAQQVWKLYQQGIIRESYFDAHQHTAVLILEGAAEQDIHQILAELPLVKAGLITFQVIPLLPYDGFQRLFAASATSTKPLS